MGHYDPSIPFSTFIHTSSERAPGNEPNAFFLFGEFLKVLAQDEAGFVSSLHESSIGKYNIDYSQTRTSLGLRILEQIIKQKFGSSSWRVFRILYFNGLMSESQVRVAFCLFSSSARQTGDPRPQQH